MGDEGMNDDTRLHFCLIMCTYFGMYHLHCVRSCIEYGGRELDILKDIDLNYCDHDPVEQSVFHNKHKHKNRGERKPALLRYHTTKHTFLAKQASK